MSGQGGGVRQKNAREAEEEKRKDLENSSCSGVEDESVALERSALPLPAILRAVVVFALLCYSCLLYF